MRKVTATFKIVTPMFLGDAEHKATGIRPPSIKGALRFWWRALNWSTALEHSPDNEDEALQWLHSEEARLFGSAATDNGGGQGVFLLRVPSALMPNKYMKGSDGFCRHKTGIQYLLGQGVWHYKDKLLREALKEGQSFVAELLFKPSVSDEDVDSVLRAFLLFGLVGGLGSRARKGFGSIVVETITSNGVVLPANICNLSEEEYISAFNQLVGTTMNTDLPPYSAFSSNTRASIVYKEGKVFNLLEKLGSEMQLYRSYGKDGLVNGEKAERNFKEDHDAVRDFSLNNLPERAVFGLPHNYFFSSSKNKVEINAMIDNEELRRASPLLLHIHQLNNWQYIGVHILFRSRFLPTEASARVKEENGRSKKLTTNVDYPIIVRYLARFSSARRIIG